METKKADTRTPEGEKTHSTRIVVVSRDFGKRTTLVDIFTGSPSLKVFEKRQITLEGANGTMFQDQIDVLDDTLLLGNESGFIAVLDLKEEKKEGVSSTTGPREVPEASLDKIRVSEERFFGDVRAFSSPFKGFFTYWENGKKKLTAWDLTTRKPVASVEMSYPILDTCIFEWEKDFVLWPPSGDKELFSASPSTEGVAVVVLTTHRLEVYFFTKGGFKLVTDVQAPKYRMTSKLLKLHGYRFAILSDINGSEKVKICNLSSGSVLSKFGNFSNSSYSVATELPDGRVLVASGGKLCVFATLGDGAPGSKVAPLSDDFSMLREGKLLLERKLPHHAHQITYLGEGFFALGTEKGVEISSLVDSSFSFKLTDAIPLRIFTRREVQKS
jgi:WD40 repeat protein